MAKRDVRGNLHDEWNGRFVEKTEAERRSYGAEYTPVRCIGAYEFHRLDTAHHLRHMMELGFSSAKAYERAAVSFFNSDRGNLYFSHARGRYYRYDEKTGEMAVASNGVVHTYMRFQKQKFKKIHQQDQLEEIGYERVGGMPYLWDKI